MALGAAIQAGTLKVDKSKKDYSISILQAVALGAAIQAGILEGQVTDVMVMDIWQASLLRALAQQRLSQGDEVARAILGFEEGQEGFSGGTEEEEGGVSEGAAGFEEGAEEEPGGLEEGNLGGSEGEQGGDGNKNVEGEEEIDWRTVKLEDLAALDNQSDDDDSAVDDLSSRH